MTLADFDYFLPPELIAQTPLPQRSASRLLELDGGRVSDRSFADLPQLLRRGDLLVMNDSRVLHARLLGRKDSGGQVEVLVERLAGASEAIAQVRASKSPKPGSRLRLEDAIEVEVVGREGEFYRLRFFGDALEQIERHGRLPLPPYIERTPESADETRYQTVFARERGSVAAPTAGLHFDHALLAELRALGVGTAFVTLHVGAGTFQPVRTERLADHRMHTERYIVPRATVEAISATRAAGGRVIAVGTTTLRTLEGATVDGELKVGAGETAIFITPGHRFALVDLLISNFHLPKSTLLMLVSAFAGLDEVRRAYRHAIDARYRFFSYGDAMLLHRLDLP
ncbi:MAG: tRNA preQ1(34) S-adenosylmethionine ribosyltransferase-isomerase QueA [Sulfuritalea sp.]|nr:tRNA preQ1(34) S-adenosylmethionine ribosyltransferase-isomerase QueA [Sulfuritalea sp.]MBP6636260.1 tRNA preQ1(34) S-adenosylmethionine ribosyltransferase-isomerase QueA [Sulfuritalea sp.]